MITSSKQSFSSLVHISFSIALVFILSGCMEDENYFGHAAAAVAGAAGATAIGYAVTKKPKPTRVMRTTTKSKRIIPATPATTIEVIEEEELKY